MKTSMLLASAASLFALSAVPAAAQLGVPPVSVPSVGVPSTTVPPVGLPSTRVPSTRTPEVGTGGEATTRSSTRARTPRGEGRTDTTTRGNARTTVPPVTTPPVDTPPVSTPPVTTPPVSTPPVTTPAVDVPTGNLPQASVRGQAQAGANASDRAAVNARAGTPPTSVMLDAGSTIASSLGTQAQLSTLAGAVTAADLTSNWNAEGPFTVFAPTNQAFDLISAANREQLMQPANKAALASILNYHVVPGRITAAELQQRIEAGGGTAQLETVGGQALTAQIENGVIVLTGANGSRAYVTQGDVAQANGMVHIVNGVLIPPA